MPRRTIYTFFLVLTMARSALLGDIFLDLILNLTSGSNQNPSIKLSVHDKVLEQCQGFLCGLSCVFGAGGSLGSSVHNSVAGIATANSESHVSDWPGMAERMLTAKPWYSCQSGGSPLLLFAAPPICVMVAGVPAEIRCEAKSNAHAKACLFWIEIRVYIYIYMYLYIYINVYNICLTRTTNIMLRYGRGNGCYVAAKFGMWDHKFGKYTKTPTVSCSDRGMSQAYAFSKSPKYPNTGYVIGL